MVAAKFFERLLSRFIGLRMAGPHREPAVAELGQNLADRTLVQFDAKPPLKARRADPPAANVRPYVAQDRDRPRPTRHNDAPSPAGSGDPSRNSRLPSCGPSPPAQAPAPISAALPYRSSCVPP